MYTPAKTAVSANRAVDVRTDDGLGRHQRRAVINEEIK
jgi:hypothetical protein